MPKKKATPKKAPSQQKPGLDKQQRLKGQWRQPNPPRRAVSSGRK